MAGRRGGSLRNVLSRRWPRRVIPLVLVERTRPGYALVRLLCLVIWGRMSVLLRPVTALLIAAGVLLMGNGLFGVLVPIRADMENFQAVEIGVLGSAYFTGLMAGCFVGPRIIGRVGHIRAFVAFTAVVTVTPLLQAMWIEPFAWYGLRVLNGICFAGLFMGIESWLTSTAEQHTRARILAVYTLINLTVVTAGMQLVNVAPVAGFELFAVVAILYSLAAVPVALTGVMAPTPPVQAELRLRWLFEISPAAVLGCLFAGFANAAFWSLTPLYGKSAGLDIPQTAMMLTIGVLAGAVAQWPAGVLSDRFGRRGLLLISALGSAVAGAGLYVFAASSATVLFVLVAAYGACAFPIYTLCVAHANDLIPRERAVEVSGGLLLTFSGAAMAGPVVAAGVMELMGPAALFLNTAAAHVLIVVVLLVRLGLRPQLPVEEGEAFVAVPRTTPAVFGLDPRTDASADETSKEDGPTAS